MYGTQSHSVSNQYGKNLGIMAEHKKIKKCIMQFLVQAQEKKY